MTKNKIRQCLVFHDNLTRRFLITDDPNTKYRIPLQILYRIPLQILYRIPLQILYRIPLQI
jgi:hypothetical protein